MQSLCFLRWLLSVGMFLFPCLVSAAERETARPPNIIFVLTDDQGPWALGASGNPDARTPNMDRLCAEGARLVNYFTPTPVCSPARASLLTSRYGTEVGITDFLSGNTGGLDAKIAAWPSVLEQAGYATALIGKWHLGAKDQHYPTNFGYQEFTGFRTGGEVSQNPKVEMNGKVERVDGFTSDILTTYAINFIRRRQNNPFLVSLHFWAPHANANKNPDGDRTWMPLSDADWKQFERMDPRVPNPDYPKLDIPRVKRMMREYLGSVASVDRNLGRLLEVVKQLQLDQNTVIILSSDNGYNLGHHGIWHKGNGLWILTDNRGDRPNLYDNSLRVPAIVWWPGKIKPGTILPQTITHLDWYPTLLAMTGQAAPRDKGIRGRNFLPLLMGESPEWNNDLFAQYSMRGAGDMRTYRTPQWKLIRDFKHVIQDELYDLSNDPGETRNLIESSDPAIQKQRQILDSKLIESLRAIDDPVLLARTKASSPPSQ